MFKILRKKIGLIGYGNMGSAIAEGIKAKYPVFVFDKDKEKTGKPCGVEAVDNIVSLVEKSEVLILAVKPQDFDGVLNEIKGCIKDKLVISIAAGITTGYIERVLGNARVVRVMPNLPAKVKEGISCLCKGRFASEEDLIFSQELFEKVGRTLVIDENMMDKATGVSGSGPGLLCDLVEGKTPEEIKDFAKNTFVPSLTTTASSLGFSVEQAEVLASITSAGTIKLIEVLRLSPEEVKKQVTSKKGTTEAGLAELKHNINNLDAAVKAAIQRAKELSKE
ncbi:MAG TPA: pyrroline-5-carboxylate reductase [Candidatus Margulisiibacteriota bacterium]|nr:pyrroline-5-carboxylate reductase [Candidatus Margulisiibacteriota bacterium]